MSTLLESRKKAIGIARDLRYDEKFIKYIIYKDCVIFQADVIYNIIGYLRIDINIKKLQDRLS